MLQKEDRQEVSSMVSWGGSSTRKKQCLLTEASKMKGVLQQRHWLATAEGLCSKAVTPGLPNGQSYRSRAVQPLYSLCSPPLSISTVRGCQTGTRRQTKQPPLPSLGKRTDGHHSLHKPETQLIKPPSTHKSGTLWYCCLLSSDSTNQKGWYHRKQVQRKRSVQTRPREKQQGAKVLRK